MTSAARLAIDADPAATDESVPHWLIITTVRGDTCSVEHVHFDNERAAHRAREAWTSLHATYLRDHVRFTIIVTPQR